MFTDVRWRLFILVPFLMGQLCLSCVKHLQEIYCKNEYVFSGTEVKAVDSRLINITKMYKGDRKKLKFFRNNIVEVMTRVAYPNAENSTYYVVGNNSGGFILPDKCNGFVLSKMLTEEQINGLRGFYNTSCVCTSQLPKYNINHFCKWRHSTFEKFGRKCRWVGSYDGICKDERKTLNHDLNLMRQNIRLNQRLRQRGRKNATESKRELERERELVENIKRLRQGELERKRQRERKLEQKRKFEVKLKRERKRQRERQKKRKQKKRKQKQKTENTKTPSTKCYN